MRERGYLQAMTRLILVRHGETEWNSDTVYRGRSEVPLSPR